MMQLLGRLGPGLMFAAVAIGVSHLVFATQAGAGYGFSLLWLVLLISFLKYPAFRFSVDYASLTGKSLVPAYAGMGRVAVFWLIIGFLGDMFTGTAAVALVTAGLLVSVLNLPATSAVQVAIGLMVASGVILLNGQYLRAEKLIKFLVVAFSVFTMIATAVSLPEIGADDRAVFADLSPSTGLFIFMIAMAGWMPIPTNGSVLISAWVREKKAAAGAQFDVQLARTDLRIGFTLTIVLAVCFVLLGTAVLFDTGQAFPESAGGFATQLLAVFTTAIGSWAYPVIAIAAIAVMWSTLLALMDVMPRVTSRLFGILTNSTADAPPPFRAFLLAQIVGCSLILVLLMGSFNTFVMFATSVGFIAAPAIAWYNYKAMTAAEIPEAARPGPGITWWNRVAIVAMVLFAAGFLYTTFIQQGS